MGGKETMQRLRALDPAVRAIVSSGYSTDPVMASYREPGFAGVVAKPYEAARLAEVVKEVLESVDL
jgi:CheY-like chemotaxis protein